jgi:hypothetical protein
MLRKPHETKKKAKHTEMGVNNDEGLFALALIDDLLGEKVL